MNPHPEGSYRWLRVTLFVAGFPPVVFGAAAALSPQHAAAYSTFVSSASIRLFPELDYALRPLGLYVLMFGALLLYATMDPPRHRVIVLWSALVFLLRGIQRLALTWQLNQLFAIPISVNLMHGFYLLLLASLLFWLRPRKAR